MIAMLSAGLTLVPRLFPFALLPACQKAWTVYITGGVRCNFTDCGCVSNLLWRWPFLCQRSQTWTNYTLFDVVNTFAVFSYVYMYVKESAPDLIFLACCGLAHGSRISNGERSGQSVKQSLKFKGKLHID